MREGEQQAIPIFKGLGRRLDFPLNGRKEKNFPEALIISQLLPWLSLDRAQTLKDASKHSISSRGQTVATLFTSLFKEAH